MDSLVTEHARRRQSIIEQLVRVLLGLWGTSTNWRDSYRARVFALEAQPFLRAGLREARQEVTRHNVAAVNLVGGQPPSHLPLTELYPRAGVSPVEVYMRPAAAAAAAAAAGKDPVRVFTERLTQIIDLDVQAVMRDETERFQDRMIAEGLAEDVADEFEEAYTDKNPFVTDSESWDALADDVNARDSSADTVPGQDKLKLYRDLIDLERRGGDLPDPSTPADSGVWSYEDFVPAVFAGTDLGRYRTDEELRLDYELAKASNPDLDKQLAEVAKGRADKRARRNKRVKGGVRSVKPTVWDPKALRRNNVSYAGDDTLTRKEFAEMLLTRERERAAAGGVNDRVAELIAEGANVLVSGKQKVLGWRRVIRPELSKTGTCGLCFVASFRMYSRKNLNAIHARCNCVVLPATAVFDPGRGMNEADLKRVYRAAGGSTYAGDLLNTRVSIREHGELGQVLTYNPKRGWVDSPHKRQYKSPDGSYERLRAVQELEDVEFALKVLRGNKGADDDTILRLEASRRELKRKVA